jgi:hypothetical protein
MTWNEKADINDWLKRTLRRMSKTHFKFLFQHLLRMAKKVTDYLSHHGLPLFRELNTRAPE